MNTHPRVFVIGAGASVDYGFPTGDGLRDKIFDLLQTSQSQPARFVNMTMNTAVMRLSEDEYESFAYASAGEAICDAIFDFGSIDSLIETRQNAKIATIGKIAIAETINKCEQSSVLFRHLNPLPGTPPHELVEMREKFNAGWIRAVTGLILDRHTAETVVKAFDEVTFIVFNYDRCLEYGLISAIKRRFAFSEEQAQELVSKIAIYHPYGRVGSPFAFDPDYVAFGGAIYKNIEDIAYYLKTYSETAKGDRIKAIESAMARAVDIIYLGFGWHRQNLQLLTPRSRANVSRIFATTYDIHNNDERIAALLRGRQIMNTESVANVELIFDDLASGPFLDSCQFRLTA